MEHPEDAEHFEEKARWGDLAYHTLPTSLPRELWPKGVEYVRPILLYLMYAGTKKETTSFSKK